MKTTHLISPILFIISLFAVATFAQLPSKIAVMNTYAFSNEKSGITKLLAAQKKVDADFKAVDDQLKTMNARLTTLAADIDRARQAPPAAGSAEAKAVQAKIDEAEKLQRDIKFQADEAKVKYEKRQEAEIGPIMQDIYKAAQEYSTQKGFLMIFDVGKMADANLIIALDDKADVTKDFITFYNARSAGAPAKPGGN